LLSNYVPIVCCPCFGSNQANQPSPCTESKKIASSTGPSPIIHHKPPSSHQRQKQHFPLTLTLSTGAEMLQSIAAAKIASTPHLMTSSLTHPIRETRRGESRVPTYMYVLAGGSRAILVLVSTVHRPINGERTLFLRITTSAASPFVCKL
jgi:hypothetical protein